MSLGDGSVGEERGHLLGEAWSHHRDDSAAAGGGGDGADTAWRPLGWGCWGVQADSLQCSWRCAEMSGFRALAVKHRLQPQQGKRNSKLSLITDAPL